MRNKGIASQNHPFKSPKPAGPTRQNTQNQYKSDSFEAGIPPNAQAFLQFFQQNHSTPWWKDPVFFQGHGSSCADDVHLSSPPQRHSFFAHQGGAPWPRLGHRREVGFVGESVVLRWKTMENTWKTMENHGKPKDLAGFGRF